MSNTSLRSSRLAVVKCALADKFKSFVAARPFPCVGAKSAMNRNRMEFGLFSKLGDPRAAADLAEQLGEFSRRHSARGVEPVSFVAMFRGQVANEDEFHDSMWSHLQAVHDHDGAENPWDASVSSDPESPAFSFSCAARAFFVVGLHPKSSRIARQAPFPCLVFNFHDQFEALRQAGKYDALQNAIRQRDMALQGSINPILARFGDGSEAAQYSGNAGKAAARCPFHARAA